MDGDRQERDLVRSLADLGWNGVRAPASGTAPREQPDVLMAKAGVVLAGELKSGTNPRNPTDTEIADLRSIGEAFAAAVVVVVRYARDRTFYFVPPEAMARTNSGNYSIPNAPERLPWSAKVEYTIDTDPDDPDADGPVYWAVSHQKDVPNVGDSPLRAWTSNVAQAQIAGAAEGVFKMERDPGPDATDATDDVDGGES